MKLTWADGGYAGKLVTWAATALRMTLQIVRRPDDLHIFQVLPRRWVVERTFAWISNCRRCTRDYERLPASHEAMVEVQVAHGRAQRAPWLPGLAAHVTRLPLGLFIVNPDRLPLQRAETA